MCSVPQAYHCSSVDRRGGVGYEKITKQIVFRTGCTVSPDVSSGSESLRRVAMTHAGLSAPFDWISARSLGLPMHSWLSHSGDLVFGNCRQHSEGDSTHPDTPVSHERLGFPVWGTLNQSQLAGCRYIIQTWPRPLGPAINPVL